MDAWIVAACALMSVIGGAIGAWVGASIKLAVLGERVANHQKEIEGLRDSRHQHADMIQAHEAKIDIIGRNLWQKKDVK